MKAKTQALPSILGDMPESHFTAKANELLREFDTILARTRKTSQRIERLRLESRRLSAELRKG